MNIANLMFKNIMLLTTLSPNILKCIKVKMYLITIQLQGYILKYLDFLVKIEYFAHYMLTKNRLFWENYEMFTNKTPSKNRE